MYNVVPYNEKYKKNIAIDLRKKGLSYSEIKKKLAIPKSTLSRWVKNIKLTPEQTQNLKDRQFKAIKLHTDKKILSTKQVIEEIKKSSAQYIQKISKRELWLMGIILYWRERVIAGNQSDIKNGVQFTSSDPYLVKLFLKWLQEVGGIFNEEIRFHIFVGEDKKDELDRFIAYWSKETGFPKKYFTNVYYQKVKKRKRRKVIRKSQHGLLRIKVRASSMLARQISGWIKGIQDHYWQE